MTISHRSQGLTTDLGSVEFWNRLEKEPQRLAAEVCFIDVSDIDKTTQRHSSLRAWINSVYETAITEHERAKLLETRARANALLNAKAVNDPVTNKAKTVQVLDAEVEINPDVIAAIDAVMVTHDKRGALRAMANAMEDRLQMLIQISAKHRQEIRDSAH